MQRTASGEGFTTPFVERVRSIRSQFNAVNTELTGHLETIRNERRTAIEGIRTDELRIDVLRRLRDQGRQTRIDSRFTIDTATEERARQSTERILRSLERGRRGRGTGGEAIGGVIITPQELQLLQGLEGSVDDLIEAAEERLRINRQQATVLNEQDEALSNQLANTRQLRRETEAAIESVPLPDITPVAPTFTQRGPISTVRERTPFGTGAELLPRDAPRSLFPSFRTPTRISDFNRELGESAFRAVGEAVDAFNRGRVLRTGDPFFTRGAVRGRDPDRPTTAPRPLLSVRAAFEDDTLRVFGTREDLGGLDPNRIGEIRAQVERLRDTYRELSETSDRFNREAAQGLLSLFDRGNLSRNLSDINEMRTELQQLLNRYGELRDAAREDGPEVLKAFDDLTRVPIHQLTDRVNDLNTAFQRLVAFQSELGAIQGLLNQVTQPVQETTRDFSRDFGRFAQRFLRPEAGRRGLRVEREQALREEEQQRARLEQRIGNIGRSFYQQFGADFILDAVGIGGRGTDRLNDALEDLQTRFEQNQEEIRSDSVLSHRERLDELQELNRQYENDKRDLERRFELERNRAWRDWVKQQLVDIPLLILEQTKLRLAARATNFVLDALGVGGGTGLGQAASVGSSALGGINLSGVGSFVGQLAGPAAVIGTGFAIAEFFNTGIPGDILGSAVNTISGESDLSGQVVSRSNTARSQVRTSGPRYVGKVEIGGKEVQEIEFVRDDLVSTGRLQRTNLR